MRGERGRRPSPLAELLAWTLSLSIVMGCATVVPPTRGTIRTPDLGRRIPSPRPAAVAVVGDVGTFVPGVPDLARAIRDRLRGAPAAPLLILGDVFYTDGLLGVCHELGDPPRSKQGCEKPTSPEDQLAVVFEPYRRELPGRPVIGIAGNHDHHADPKSTDNACALFPSVAPKWSYLAHGCGLDRSDPVRTIDLGEVVLFVVDSEQMIRDADDRQAAATALRAQIARSREERPDAWRVLATHHPLESYGLHNGASPLTALHKDLYWLTQTALLPLSFGLERTLLSHTRDQNLYAWGYRAYRRAVYDALRDAPVDLVVSGHDHSLQLVRVDHPGVRYQVVSGSGAYHTPVKRRGLDLLFLNRLARLARLGSLVPAPAHELLFASGKQDELGFAVLVPDRDRLFVEIYSATSPEPLAVYAVSQAPR